MFNIERGARTLIAFSLLSSFGVSAVFPYIPIFGKEIGMPVFLIGNLVLLYYLLQAVTRIPLGKISDIVGHHAPIMIGSLLYFISAGSFVASIYFWPTLFLGEIALGVANSVIWVTVPSYITESEGALPLYSFSIGLGWLLGSPVGGYIKDTFGMSAVFLTLLSVSVVLIYLSWEFYYGTNQEGRRESVRGFIRMARLSPTSLPVYPSLKSYVEGWRLLNTNRHLLFAGLFSFIVFMTFGLGSSIVPLYFSEVGITSFLIGILVSIRLATSTSIRLTSKFFTRRFGDYRVLVTSTIVAGTFIILVSRTQAFPLIAIFSALWGLGSGMYLPIVFDIIGKHSTEEERGIAMGIRGTLGTLGAAFGTWAFSSLAASLSLDDALFFAGVFTVASSIVLGLVFRGEAGGKKAKQEEK